MTEGVFRHKDIKIDYARVLLQSHVRSTAPSRREPSFDLCEHIGKTHEISHSIVGTGVLDGPKNENIPPHKRRAHDGR